MTDLSAKPSDATEAPLRPELTMPPAEAAWLTEFYEQAGTILEYGSGGSTALAATMPNKTVFSVENDTDWMAKLRAYLAAHPPAADLTLHEVDIGRTKAWGMPARHAGWRRYHRYPVSVWDREDFVHPDVILIDGRFRPACLVTAMIRARRPVTVLFDDYLSRPGYRAVERFARPAEIRGRMARFDLAPRPLPPEDLAVFLEFFTRPL